MSRLAATFAALKKANRAAFVPFVTAGDPDMEISHAILSALPGAGADIIELGMPFTDPMADGPAIQAASLRALKSGATVSKVLDLVRKFRKADAKTPIVLMGYFNPIHAYGTARFIKDAAAAGVDGIIPVDVPPEEDEVLRVPAKAQNIDLVRLITPTTNNSRLETVLKEASGYVYYVSFTGVTGSKTIVENDVGLAMDRLRAKSDIPCTVGFGIKTPEQAGAIARLADGAVVGSAIVERIAAGLSGNHSKDKLVSDVTEFCRALAKSVHAARE